MGICTRRHFLLTICVLQLLSTIERQVFDFLGFMWAPILANFFHMIFVIFGFFGAFQFRPKYIITYIVWCFLWIGWNVFVICFYLDVGILDKDSDVLNLGTGSVSWWEVNGVGCKPNYNNNNINETVDDPDPFRPIRPERVFDCVLEYQYVEVLHATLQCILAVLGGMGGIFVSSVFLEEDDSSQANNKYGKKRGGGSNRTSLYSIEFSPHDDSLEYEEEVRSPGPQLSPRPMTPRRVKRRSVISRGTSVRTSSQDKRGSVRYSNAARSSLRASARRVKHQNPVTRLIEQQQSLADTSITSGESASARLNPTSQADLLLGVTPWKRPAGHTNPLYQQNSTQSLNADDDVYNNRPSSARSSYSNYHGARPISCYVGPGGTQSYYMAGQAVGQVPVMNAHRRSNHNLQRPRPPASTFLNGGPPPYHVQGAVDSETVI